MSDIKELLEPLEHAISDALIPSITGHTCTTSERELLALPMRKGGLGLENPVERAGFEHAMSLQVTAPLVAQIVSQAHEPPDDALIRSLQLTTRKERHVRLDNKLEDLRNSLPEKTKRAVDLATEKGALRWLTVIPVKEIDLNLNKREFKDAVHLRYDWQISGVPNVCVCGEPFDVDDAMISKRRGFIIQRDNELRDLEAQMLNLVCHDVEIEPVLQEITSESLAGGGLIQPPIPGLTFMHGVFGVDRLPHSLTYGCATQIQNLTMTSPLSKYIASMRTRRNVCTQAKLWRWSKPRSCRWCPPLQVAWHLNVKSITSD